MPKKILVLLCVLPLIFTGCRSSHQIENAAVIEEVSVNYQDGQLYYTFYPLTDSGKPEAVAVPAESFEQARSLAEQRYIPNLTLAKLGLLLIEQNVDSEVMRGDIYYISTQASVSPVALVALCDSRTLERLKSDSSARRTIGRQIARLRRDDPEIKTDYLSVFNCYARRRSGGFYVPLITCGGELRASRQKISAKN